MSADVSKHWSDCAVQHTRDAECDMDCTEALKARISTLEAEALDRQQRLADATRDVIRFAGERDDARRECDRHRLRAENIFAQVVAPLREAKVCRETEDESPRGCILRLIEERDDARRQLDDVWWLARDQSDQVDSLLEAEERLTKERDEAMGERDALREVLRDIACHGHTRPLEMGEGNDGDGHWKRIAQDTCGMAARAVLDAGHPTTGEDP